MRCKIENTGYEVTISSGDGNDSIVNEDSNSVSIDGGKGNDSIYNGVFKVRKETVPKSYAHGVTTYKEIFAMDEFFYGGSDVTITAGNNDDIIQSFGGSNIKIDSGDGKNQVSLGGKCKNIEVNTGSGDDIVVVYSASENVYFNNAAHSLGGGKDVTLNTGGGQNFVHVGSTWKNVEINGGNKQVNIDTFFNEADHAIIRGYAGLDVIENSGESSFVVGGADGDMLINYGNKVYIDGGAGIDHIYSDKGENVTIDGGEGADTIEVFHDVGASVSGGDGNDNIFVGRVSADDHKEASKALSTTIIDAVLSGLGVPLTTSTNLRDWSLTLSGAIFGNTELGVVGKLKVNNTSSK